MSETSDARFEFRTFGQNFSDSVYRMSRLSDPVPEKFWHRVSDEIYLIFKDNDVMNFKIRNNLLDIKTLKGSIDGLERWTPTAKLSFPLSEEVIRADIVPLLGDNCINLESHSMRKEELLSNARKHPDLQLVQVAKERHGYMIKGTICEAATVFINGARLSTVGVESVSPNDVKLVMRDLGLDGFENINYLQAIKRVIGWVDRPLLH